MQLSIPPINLMGWTVYVINIEVKENRFPTEQSIDDSGAWDPTVEIA